MENVVTPACFFDMDGTLIDSRADLATAVNVTRRDLGLPAWTSEAVLRCVGNGARYLLEHAIPEPFADMPEAAGEDVLSTLRARYRENYLAHMLDETTLYPGVRATLEKLAEKGVPLGINTNKPGDATRGILKHFGLDGLFGEAIVGGGDCAELKPSPLPLVACAERLHRTLAPGDVMVGDNWTDLACAKNAGIRAAYCRWGFGTLRDATYDVALERMNDLLSFLSANRMK